MRSARAVPLACRRHCRRSEEPPTHSPRSACRWCFTCPIQAPFACLHLRRHSFGAGSAAWVTRAPTSATVAASRVRRRTLVRGMGLRQPRTLRQRAGRCPRAEPAWGCPSLATRVAVRACSRDRPQFTPRPGRNNGHLKAETFELADTSALQALSVTTVEVLRAEPRTLPGAEHVVADFRGCGGRRRRRLCGARGGRLPRRKCG